MGLPEAFYQPYYKPKKKPKPPTPRRGGAMGDLLTDWEPPQSDIATFWDIYHEMDGDGAVSPEVAKIKAAVTAAAGAKGLTVKGDLEKTIQAFLEVGSCPWVHEMCPCTRLTEDGVCKKKMLV
jgi:hypothetical protein